MASDSNTWEGMSGIRSEWSGTATLCEVHVVALSDGRKFCVGADIEALGLRLGRYSAMRLLHDGKVILVNPAQIASVYPSSLDGAGSTSAYPFCTLEAQ